MKRSARSGKEPGGGPARCIWRRRYPIAGRRGRKRDFVDAERLVNGWWPENDAELVPIRATPMATVTRKKYQLRRDLVRIHNN